MHKICNNNQSGLKEKDVKHISLYLIPAAYLLLRMVVDQSKVTRVS